MTITGPDSSSGPRSPSAGTGWTNPTNVYTSNSVVRDERDRRGRHGLERRTRPASASRSRPPRRSWGSPSRSSGSRARAATPCRRSRRPAARRAAPSSSTRRRRAELDATASIAYNASAATIQTALVTIYGSGQRDLHGRVASRTAVVCTFAGADANQADHADDARTRTALTGGIVAQRHVSRTRRSAPSARCRTTPSSCSRPARAVGSNKASATTWGTTDSTVTYGTLVRPLGHDLDRRRRERLQLRPALRRRRTSRPRAPPPRSTTSRSRSPTSPTRTGSARPATPVKTANIGGTCTYLLQAAHTPCTSTDHVYATTITSTSAASNPALVMPAVDFNYWWANAAPGPKHFCTNSNPGLATNFFDNDAGHHLGAEQEHHGQRRDGSEQRRLHLPGGRRTASSRASSPGTTRPT